MSAYISAGIRRWAGDSQIKKIWSRGTGDQRLTGYQRADGLRAIDTNGDPIFEDDEGFAEAWLVGHPAYQEGYRDGLDWDLDGFSTIEDVQTERYGWDSATISAVGSSKCAEAWGVNRAEGDEWEAACAAYNAGAHAGACAATGRTGLPPRDDETSSLNDG